MAADEHCVAANLIEEAIFDKHVFGVLDQHRATAKDSPVAAQQLLPRLHERALCMAKGESAQGDASRRRALLRTDLDEIHQTNGIDGRSSQIDIRRRIEIERGAFLV